MLFRWNDDATWKRFVSLAQEGRLDEIRDALDEYTRIAVYHGCRPDDPNTYFQQGLKLSDADELNRRAEQIFLTPEFPGVTKAKLQQAMNEEAQSDDRKLYVVLDEERFMELSAHYLIYGSEYLLRLANRLHGRGMVRPDVLKRYGIPTLFEIHVPVHELPQEQWRQLAKNLLLICGDRDLDQRRPLDFGFTFQNPLPGSWIKKHIHPEEIVDRTSNVRSIYRYKDR